MWSQSLPTQLLRCLRLSVTLIIRISAIVIISTFFNGLFLTLSFKLYPWTVGYLIFMNHVHFPPYRNYSDLAVHRIHGENLYLTSGQNQLGVWKLEPNFQSPSAPVILYIHGAQGSRAAYHRIELYRVLQQIGCPVVTFDYRGYGDSTGVPTSELDLLDDAMVVFRWTMEQFPGRQLFLWGHSLGTGVSVRLVQTIEKSQPSSHAIDGIILDSPYSSMFEVLRLSPLLNIFHQVPAFTEVVLNALNEADVTLNSSDRIRHTRVPVLILHAQDDWVIPVVLSQRLFDVAQQRNGVLSEYVQYNSELKYGHRGIYRDPVLPERVLKFAKQAAEWSAGG